MTPPEITAGGILGILGGILATIGAVFTLWKKKSNTQVAVTEDYSRINWISDLDIRMHKMQAQMEALLITERSTYNLHQECLRISERLSDRVAEQEMQLTRLRKLLYAVRPELKEVFGGTSIPGTLGE